MPRRMKGKVVVVTGASAGLGRAIARAFAKQGAAVGLLARGTDGLAGAVRDCEDLGGRGLAIPTDVADAERVDSAAAQIERALGPIDIWVNNAMVSVFSPVLEMKAEEYLRVTQVTYLGVVHGTLAALRRMVPRDRGVILQSGSALAYRGIPLQSAYCAAKHAIQGFTESLRSELIHDGSRVRITMIQLPAMNTPQFDWVKSRLPHRAQPVPPIFQPEVAAKVFIHAAQHDRREYFVGLPTVEAIVGNAVAPSYLDRYLARTGFASQQTNQPEDPGRPNNLYDPLPGDHGARGRFDDRSLSFSPQVWTDLHRKAVGVGLGIAAAAAIVSLPPRRHASPGRNSESRRRRASRT